MSRKKIEKQGLDQRLAKGVATIPAETMGFYPYIMENTEYMGTDYDAYIALLNEGEEFTSRAVVDGANIQYFVLDAKKYESFIKAGYPKELLDGILKNSGIGMKIGRNIYPIGEAAVDSFWRMATANRDYVSKKALVNFWNEAICSKKTAKGRNAGYTITVRGGKVTGGASEVYTPLPANMVMRVAKEAIEKEYGEIETQSTYFNDSFYRAIYKLTGEEATNMEAIFKDQVAKRIKATCGKEVDEEDIKVSFGFLVKTGETGSQTATIKSHISFNYRAGVTVGEDLVFYHKGIKDLESEIPARIGNIFVNFQDTINALIKAADIKVMSWRDVIVGLAEANNIPEDVWKNIIVEFANSYKDDSIVTAYDIFTTFLDSTTIFMSLNPGASDNAIELYNTKLMKILKEDISKYDNDSRKTKEVLSKQYLVYPVQVLTKACAEIGVPVCVRKKLVLNLTDKATRYALLNDGEEMPVTAFDIYEDIINSGGYMRQWFIDTKKLDGDVLESRMAKYLKAISKAKKVSYIALDVDDDADANTEETA